MVSSLLLAGPSVQMIFVRRIIVSFSVGVVPQDHTTLFPAWQPGREPGPGPAHCAFPRAVIQSDLGNMRTARRNPK